MTRLASCSCGQVKFELVGASIMTTECYCESCRSAGETLETSGVRPFRQADGSTRFVLHKKSKIEPVSAPNGLVEFRLAPDSPTRRIIAACCDSAMFLEFENGHWLSVYAASLDGDEVGAVEERTMLSDMPDGWDPPDDGVRNSAKQSAKFFGKLLWAWATMGFRSPANDWVSGTYEPQA